MVLNDYFEQDPSRRNALAESLGCNADYLWQIATERRRASPALARRIEAATGGVVTRAELRPDVWAEAA